MSNTKSNRREKGQGSIYQRPNGKYVGTIRYTLPNGVQKSKSFTGKTEAEVRKKIREYNRNQDTKEVSHTSLGSYVENWLYKVKYGTIKNSSFDKLEATAKNHVLPELGMIRLDQLKEEDVMRLLKKKKRDGLSYSTVKKIHDLLHAVMGYAIQKEDIRRNPMDGVKMLNKQLFEQKEIKAFTKEELKRIFKEARRKYSTGMPVYQYGEVFIAMYHLGVRIGEIIGVLKSDIDWDKREIRIQRGAQRVKVRNEDGRATGCQEMVVTTTKSKKSKRILAINKSAMVSLRRLCDANPHSELLVCTQNGGMTNATRVERCFSSILKNAGIEHAGLHSLRHSCATHLCINNTPIKDVAGILGHERASFSLDTYVEELYPVNHEAMEKLEDIGIMED